MELKEGERVSLGDVDAVKVFKRGVDDSDTEEVTLMVFETVIVKVAVPVLEAEFERVWATGDGEGDTDCVFCAELEEVDVSLAVTLPWREKEGIFEERGEEDTETDGDRLKVPARDPETKAALPDEENDAKLVEVRVALTLRVETMVGSGTFVRLWVRLASEERVIEVEIEGDEEELGERVGENTVWVTVDEKEGVLMEETEIVPRALRDNDSLPVFETEVAGEEDTKGLPLVLPLAEMQSDSNALRDGEEVRVVDVDGERDRDDD